jgi:hypothetical protein
MHHTTICSYKDIRICDKRRYLSNVLAVKEGALKPICETFSTGKAQYCNCCIPFLVFHRMHSTMFRIAFISCCESKRQIVFLLAIVS